MTTKAEKAADLAHALETLAKYLRAPNANPPMNDDGTYPAKRQTVYALVGHVAKSGMSRDIKFFVVHEGELVSLTWAIATVCGHKMTDNGLRVGGGGMDMRFAVLDQLAHKLGGEFKSGNDFRIDGL